MNENKSTINELFEDGRSLGRVRCVADGGYWMLASDRSGARPNRR